MQNNRTNSVVRYIRMVAAAQCEIDLPDRELLDRFVNRHDSAAYAALVHRHGPMVLRLCIRLLQNEQDAEDAFQATFLVLIRKAGSLLPHESLGGWLYGVAYRIAQKARIDAARRRKFEGRAAVTRVTDPLAQITVREAQEILDKEIARLPDKLRVPLVLCCLEGLTRDEAAKQLGLPASTLKSRLEEARERLRARLASRGLALAGALTASAFSEGTTSAALPSVLLHSTVETACSLATGAATASVVPSPVAALAGGVLKAMFVTKIKIAMAVLLALASIGTVVRMAQLNAAGPGPQQNSAPGLVSPSGEKTTQAANDEELRNQLQVYTWFVVSRNAAENTITLHTQPYNWPSASGTTIVPPASGVVAQPVRQGIDMTRIRVAEDAEIIIDGQNRSLEDLQRGMAASIQTAQDRPTITRIDAMRQDAARLKGVDADKKATITDLDFDKRRITVSVGGQECTVPLAADALIAVRGKSNAQPLEMSDLSIGMWIFIQLKADGDKLVVTSLLAKDE